MFKKMVVALTFAVISAVGIAQAQENNVTLTLKSGERVTGTLIDLGGVGFSLTVNGQPRRIRTDDVSVIDFTGSTPGDVDWSRVSANNHVVWLRNGETIDGTLYDISGRNPLKLTFKTSSGERQLNASEVGRIVLARPSDSAVATTGAATVPAGEGIAVPANQQWVATGLTVRRGERLTFNTTGDAQLSNDTADMAGSAGSKAGRRGSPNYPMPNELAGALIGRIGNSAPFGIGNLTTVDMPAAGQLFLGINDDNVSDNHGGFRVQITRSGRRR